MTPRAALWFSVFFLLVAWAVDMLTPPAFVAAILLTAPVALASIYLEKRYTFGIVGLAIVADVVAGWHNGLQEGGHWDPIVIANRLLAALSVVLVGVLGNMAKTAAKRSARLAARERQADRAASIRHAFERIRSTLNVDLVNRAVVREAVVTLGADAAWLFVLDGSSYGDVAYAYDKDWLDVAVRRERPATGLAQYFRKAVDLHEVIALSPTDPAARLCLDSLGADHARIVPIFDARSALAVLTLVARTVDCLDAELEPWLQSFGEQAGVAISQAKIFVELGRKNEELADAIRALGERGDVIRDIVYALSHDLRTPLAAAAMTHRQGLEGKYGILPEAYREILRRSIESNNELQRLAETLLMVAKYESGEQSTARAPVALGVLARNIVDELEPLWLSKGIRMRVGDDESAVASGDDVELRRVVMNLLANAIAWTSEGGTIAVGIARNGQTVSLSVEDDGYGVPASERDTLFQRLPARSAYRPGSGSGLGLYIVRRIAENHGGGVTYQPGEPSGSRFLVTLPAYSRPDAHV